MNDTNTDVDVVIIGDGMLGNVGECFSTKQDVTRSSNPCDGCHSKAMVVQLDSQSSADVWPYFVMNQANIVDPQIPRNG